MFTSFLLFYKLGKGRLRRGLEWEREITDYLFVLMESLSCLYNATSDKPLTYYNYYFPFTEQKEKKVHSPQRKDLTTWEMTHGDSV